MPQLDENLKMKVIIKTYILLRGKATADELAQFLNENYNWRIKVTSRKVAGICRQTNHHNYILYGLKKRQMRVNTKKICEYYY